MRRGFTVLELLVASLLLGMLMTILTMIFNQSSIAWRTGVASVQDMDDAREKVAAVRYEADNAYPDIDGKLLCVRSVFDDDNGGIRTDRLVKDFDGGIKGIASSVSDSSDTDSFKSGVSCGGSSGSGPKINYIVNVRSLGPDRDKERYDNIYGVSPINDSSEW